MRFTFIDDFNSGKPETFVLSNNSMANKRTQCYITSIMLKYANWSLTASPIHRKTKDNRFRQSIQLITNCRLLINIPVGNAIADVFSLFFRLLKGGYSALDHRLRSMQLTFQ